MFFKSKLFISTLIALPVSFVSFEVLADTFKLYENISSNVNNNLTKSETKRLDNNYCSNVPKSGDQRINRLLECLNNRHQKKKNRGTTNTSIVKSNWILPWPVGVTGRVSQRWHSDSWGRNKSLDFALPAGTPVLVPVDSKVVEFCNAGNNHLSIRLQSTDGQMYGLVHVKSSSVSTNKTYKQGEQIGVIAGDRPWNRCAKSTGPHLHFSLPQQNFTVGSYKFSPTSIPKYVTAQKSSIKPAK